MILKLLGVVALGSRFFAEDSPPTYWDDAWPAEYNNDTNQLMLSYLISKWHFERNYFQHHFMILKIYGRHKGPFLRSALGQKPEFTKLVSKMINHTRFIATPGLSHWQKIKSFGIRGLRFFWC